MASFEKETGLPRLSPTSSNVSSPQTDSRASSITVVDHSMSLPHTPDGRLSQDTAVVPGGAQPALLADDKSETAVSRSNSQAARHDAITQAPPTPAGTTESTKERVPDEPQLYGFEKLAQRNPGPWDHTSMTLGGPVIILFDIVIPCIIYYVWFNIHRDNWVEECNRDYISQGQACPIPKPLYDEDILGYSVISFGFGELYILAARVKRLLMERDDCAPLLSRSKWELDATSWVYAVSMIVALIPFVVGASLQIPELYLYGPSFLMGFLGVIMLVTMIPFTIPIGINSHARGTALRPFIYYAAEDFIAVDGIQNREFRIRYNRRYDTDKNFRLMFLELTIWWIFGVLVYIGCVSAVIWTLDFNYAFGLTLGILFAYIIIWAAVSVFWVRLRMHQMKKARMGPIPNNV